MRRLRGWLALPPLGVMAGPKTTIRDRDATFFLQRGSQTLGQLPECVRRLAKLAVFFFQMLDLLFTVSQRILCFVWLHRRDECKSRT